MEIFTSTDTDMQMWFELERFISTWTIGVSLELAIREAILLCMYARSVEAQPWDTVNPSDLLTSIESGFRIANDLEILANQIDLLASDRRMGHIVFNGLFDCSTKMNRAIAKSLYTSIRVHVLENIEKLLLKLEHVSQGDSKTSSLRSQCQVAATTTLRTICEDVSNLFGLGHEVTIDNQPGMPYRGFWMLWPISVVLSSPLAEMRQKSWARNIARFIGERTGIGLVLLIAMIP